VAFYERGLGISASQFLRALLSRYEVELHNFNPNSISQAAIFVVVARGTWVFVPTGTSGSTSSGQSTSPRRPMVEAHGRW
jgi:hypothetical protein